MKLNKTFTKIEFTRKEYRGILGNLRKIYKLIEKPKNWVKGDYETEVFNPKTDKFEPQMCLMGANNVADGPNEANTDVFMCFNLPEPFLGRYITRLKFLKDYDEDKDGLLAELYAISDGEQAGGDVESFNDSSKTTHKIIITWLRRLIKKAERLAA